MTTNTANKDRAFAWVRWAGLGALVLLAVVSSVAPTAATSPGPDLDGLRRADRFQTRYAAFRGTKPVPMGVFEANGAPMELSFFQVGAPASVVLDHYASEFARGDRHVDRRQEEIQGIVSYYDETQGSMVAVHTFEQRKGGQVATLVFASIVDGPEALKLSSEPPADLPSPEGAVTAMRVDDPAGGSSTVTQVAQGTTGEVAAQYRAQLLASGWKPTEEKTQNGVQLLSFERAGLRLAMTVAGMGKEGAAESVVTLIRDRPKEVRQ